MQLFNCMTKQFVVYFRDESEDALNFLMYEAKPIVDVQNELRRYTVELAKKMGMKDNE